MEAMKTNPEAARDETNNATVGKPMVEDYAASDASLEQVFLSFARETVPNHPTLPDSIPYITQLWVAAPEDQRSNPAVKGRMKEKRGGR